LSTFDVSKVLQREASFLHPEQGEHKHDPTISSVGMQFDGPKHAGKLNSWLTALLLLLLLRDHGVDIVRSKGVPNLMHGSGARTSSSARTCR